MRPSIGARLVWTSKSDKKIPTRRVFALRTSFSSDSTISLTVPSAAATIRFGSAGTGRSGSRKKATVKRKSARKTSEDHAETNQVAAAANAKIRRIQRASFKVFKRIAAAPILTTSSILVQSVARGNVGEGMGLLEPRKEDAIRSRKDCTLVSLSPLGTLEPINTT